MPKAQAFDLLTVIGAPAQRPLRIADREFEVRPFSQAEGLLLQAADGVEAQNDLLAQVLNARLKKGEEVDRQWLLDTLSITQLQAVYEILAAGRFPDENGGDEGK